MLHKHRISAVLLLLSGLSFDANAEAGDIEITPYGAFSIGGTFSDSAAVADVSLDDSASFGILLNFRDGPNTQWEILYSRQAADADVTTSQAAQLAVDIDVHYLQGGGTYQGDGNIVRPFLSATLGATHFDVKSSGYDSDTFFSFSLGPGLQIRPNERIGIRLEARIFGTLVQSDSNLFCISDPASMSAGCALRVDGEVFWQTQLMAGLVFRF